MSRAANTLWARAFVDELARCGVREVTVSPGSRSTPLVLAMAMDGRFRLRVHLDERSAAFFALGVGKSTGLPGAVVTTSGTATANLYPAVVEAAQSEVPLLLLTADRPPRLRGADANQAIDQHGMYGGYVRAFFETAAAALEDPALRHLRSQACRAVAATQGLRAGPVHVNLPFAKPLEPGGDDEIAAFAADHPLAAGGRPDGRPFVSIEPVPTRGFGTVEAFASVHPQRRGVIVAGPVADPGTTGPLVVDLAQALGWPLLADPLSGARWTPGADGTAIPAYDLFLRDPALRASLAPEVVLRIGAAPTSTALQSWLEDHNGVDQVVIASGDRWKDHGAIATSYVVAVPGDALEALTEKVSNVARGADAFASRGASGALGAPGAPGASAGSGGPSVWRDRWRTAGNLSAAALAEDARDAPAHEGRILGALTAEIPAETTLFISSSMPVRDLDAYGLPRDARLRVLGNRGASGIDGIVSTAFGAADGPTLCVLGDVAFFHDQNGLLFARERDRPVVFVLIDNDGGGIFHMLPVADREPWFTEFFATPHGLDFRHAADLHGVPFEDVEIEDVAAAAVEALGQGVTSILRVRTDRVHTTRRRAEVVDRVIGSVRDGVG